MIEISLLITTYNDPLRLEKTLSHYLKLRPQPLEILVCDDGSASETKTLVDAFARRFNPPLIHVYQEHRGWDAPGVRNLGAIRARGNYLVMTDGDCVPHPKFIQDHLAAAEKGCFVIGNRSHVRKEHVRKFSTRADVVVAYLVQK
jgi:glycosyltransferase involved in cell wall biosynthesis